jgi:hypothetical protein
VTNNSPIRASIAPLDAADRAKGQHRAFQRSLRVGGRPTIGVQRPAQRNCAPLFGCHHHLALCHLTQAEFSHQVIARASGNSAAIGFVSKIGCRPPAAGIATGEFAKPSTTRPA